MKKAFGKISRGIITFAVAAFVFAAGRTSAKAAERVSLDLEYKINMESEEKVYEYTFTTPKEGSFHIETEVNISDTDNLNYCNVKADFSSGEKKYWDTYLNVNGKDSSLEYSLRPNTDVTLKFDTLFHGYSESNTYELKFKIVTNVPNNFEKEGNDTPSKAVKIKKNKAYHGILNEEDKDEDWYVFKAPKTEKYRFYVKNTSNTGKSTSVQVFGYKTKKKSDNRNNATVIEGLKEYKSKKIKLNKGKKYYIKICGASPCTASYELKIKKVK